MIEMINFKNTINRFSLLTKISIIFLVFLILAAITAPIITPYYPDKEAGPVLKAPNKNYIFGTDDLGRDLFTQIIYGARVSLIIASATAFISAFISAFIGTVVGISSAYFGGLLDKIFMRVIDIIIILPQLPLIIVLSAFFGSSFINIILVISFFSWTMPARIVRSKIISLKEKEYIKSAESYGAGIYYLIKRHFLPQIFPLLSVSIIKISGKAVMMEAGLSFLGLGDPTSKSWGLILNFALNFKGIYYTSFWKWWLVFPWLFLTLLIVSLSLIAKELEDIYALRS